MALSAANKYEPQSCPRCGTGFICKPNNIGSCDCMAITISKDEQKFISAQYLDCVCSACLKELKYAYYLSHHHNKPMDHEPEI